MPGNKPSPAKVGKSLGGWPPENQGILVLTTWHECWASFLVLMSGGLDQQTRNYRTLNSYKLFWAVCHLFPQRWQTLTYSVSGNHWPGGPRDMFKTTFARKFMSCVFESPTRRVFSINTSSSNTLVLFDQISSQQQHTPFSVNQQERKATLWIGLVDIHIQWLWDAFQSLRNCPFLTIKKDILNL